MKPPFINHIDLDHTFVHTDSSYRYTIRWTKTCGSGATRSKPPLVLVHGTPWSSLVWSDFAQALSSNYDVYIFDHAGFGQSPPREPLDPDAASADDVYNHSAHLDASHTGQAATFAALLQYWGLSSVQGKDLRDIKSPPHVIAHDNGCLTALRANIIHGCRYTSLALVNGVVVGPFDTSFFQTVSSQRELFLNLPAHVCDGIVHSYVKHAAYFPLDQEIENMLSQPWLEGGAQGPKQFWRQILQASRRDISQIEDRYQEVGAEMPVCVIWGKDDDWIPVDRAQRIADAVGAGDVVLIKDAGHLVMVDQPVKFGIELANWLNQNSMRSKPTGD